MPSVRCPDEKYPAVHLCNTRIVRCPASSKRIRGELFILFSYPKKRPTLDQCKPFISNEFLVGSASFELATPAV